MAAVFPQVETWQTQRSDLLLVGSKRRHTYSARALAARIAEDPFKQALADTWRAVDLNGLLGHYLANDTLARAFATAPNVELNTDDRNVVEFGLARSVGRAESSVIADLRQLAVASNAARPLLDDEVGINWTAVDTAWITANAAQGSFAGLMPQGPPAEQARQIAMLRYHENGEIAGARLAWPRDADPRDPNELAMLADVEAEAASDAALPLIERLRAYQPGEADVFLAKLRLRQSRTLDAAAALESAFTRFRSDPWPAPRLKQLAVDLAETVVKRDDSLARRMFTALGQPFAVHALEDARLIARAELSMQFDEAAACQGAVGPARAVRAVDAGVPHHATRLLSNDR